MKKFILGSLFITGLIGASFGLNGTFETNLATSFGIPPPPLGPSYNPPPPSAPKGFPTGYTGMPTPSGSYSPPLPPPGYQTSGGNLPSGYRPTPPIPPVPKTLKNYPLDLDLLDFANRNPLPTQHCFFPVKGRKDVVEYDPEQKTYRFPKSHWCDLNSEKCNRATKLGYLPGMKKTKQQIPFESEESAYQGFPVIPYEYTEDIDYSTCMPSESGYLEVDNYKIHQYERPKRNYAQKSCYHGATSGMLPDLIFCDKNRCTFNEFEYCNNKTEKCYKNGYPLKDKNGKPVVTYEYWIQINWDWCLNKEGVIIPEDGGPPYEERFNPGCSYRIEAPNYHEKQYAKYIDFLIKCDEYRCYNPGFNFDIKKKEYWMNLYHDKIQYFKTPPLSEFLTINWTCLDANKAPDFNKELLCAGIYNDPDAPNCRLCYENKKFVYKDCKIPYDEFGRRKDIPEEWRNFSLYDEAVKMEKTIFELRDSEGVMSDLLHWFITLRGAIERSYDTIDEVKRHGLAFRFAKFNALKNKTEEDFTKFKRDITPSLPDSIKKHLKQDMEEFKKGMCYICRTAPNQTSENVMEACGICRK